MTPDELLMRLNDQGIKLWADGDKLRYKAPSGALTPELLAEIAKHKAEILTLLRAAQDLLDDPALPITPVSRQQPLPLSFAQQQLWHLNSLTPASSLPLAIRLRGPLDSTILLRALAAVQRRHETLRTSFAIGDGQPVQLIAPATAARPTLALPLLDLAGLPATRHAQSLQALANAACRQPFDLARGPLLRAVLLRATPHEHVLLLVLSALIADDWSLDVLADDISALYDAASAGQLIVLPVLPIQYADYAIWQRGRLHGPRIAAQLAYWQRQLNGASTTLTLLADHPHPTHKSTRDATQTFTLAQPPAAALHSLSQLADTTLFVTLLAAFLTLLYHETGRTDLVVGTPIANRARAETEGLIGPFANMLALRVQLDGQMRYWELLAQVREVCQIANANADIPFEQVQAALEQVALFQVVFALQTRPQTAAAPTDRRTTRLPLPSSSAEHALTLTLLDATDGLYGTFAYRAELFEAPTITRLWQQFQALLARIVADPQRRLTELPQRK